MKDKYKKYIVWAISGVIAAVLIYFITKQIREHYVSDDPVLKNLKEKLEKVHPSAKKIDMYVGKKSYTINKKRVYMCLKDKYQDYYPPDMLMYVGLHELAHVICDEVGHTDKFKKIFAELLKDAAEKGVYNPNHEMLFDYCEHNQDVKPEEADHEDDIQQYK